MSSHWCTKENCPVIHQNELNELLDLLDCPPGWRADIEKIIARSNQLVALEAQLSVLEPLLKKIDAMSQGDPGYWDGGRALSSRNDFNTGLIAASAPIEAKIYTLKQTRDALKKELGDGSN